MVDQKTVTIRTKQVSNRLHQKHHSHKMLSAQISTSIGIRFLSKHRNDTFSSSAAGSSLASHLSLNSIRPQHACCRGGQLLFDSIVVYRLFIALHLPQLQLPSLDSLRALPLTIGCISYCSSYIESIGFVAPIISCDRGLTYIHRFLSDLLSIGIHTSCFGHPQEKGLVNKPIMFFFRFKSLANLWITYNPDSQLRITTACWHDVMFQRSTIGSLAKTIWGITPNNRGL